MEVKQIFSVKNASLCLFIAVVLLSCFYIKADAYLAPGVYVTELKIDKVEYGQISGEINIVSDEKYYLDNLSYEIKLFKGNSYEDLKLIDIYLLKDKTTINPSGVAVRSFIYNYPQNIISGDYTMRAQIIDERGGELGWKDKVVSLKGTNKFLDIFNTESKVLANGKEYYPLVGVNIFPTENVVGLLKVKNPGGAVIIIPNIKIYQRHINMSLIKEYNDSPITFAKGETKEISLVMPKIDVPESYLAEVIFYQNNEQVSGTQYFRWVVKGEGGKILNIKINKDYFNSGENIELIVESIGPADMSDIGTGKLEISVLDKNGNLIIKTEKDVLLNSNIAFSAISIPIKNSLVSPEINVKLIKNGRIFDERSSGRIDLSQEAKDLEKKIEIDKIANEKRTQTYMYSLIAIIIFIILSVLGGIIYKKSKLNNVK